MFRQHCFEIDLHSQEHATEPVKSCDTHYARVKMSHNVIVPIALLIYMTAHK